MVGTGRGATAGVLIRNAEALERMEKVDTLVIDKTGTLTVGKPALASAKAVRGNHGEILRLAASLELGSEHPLAKAIVRGAEALHLELRPVTGLHALPGKGIVGHIEGKEVAVGNVALLTELGVPAGSLKGLPCKEGSVIFVAVGRKAAGCLEIVDTIKPSTPEALRALRAEGVRVIMLTGDNRAAAEGVARALDIHAFEAEVLPARKAEAVKRLQQQGRVVAMAGDGVNDAPALAAADVGIAMGTGTDVAMESSGITLVKGDLRGVVRALRLSRATMRNIRQNLFFAFIYNVIGIPVAAGVLYPIFGASGLLSPMIAAAAMSFSSVSVISNSLRLRKIQL
jgi:P-type Cu+ transporter